jgi:hypothetical protein
LLSDLGSHTKPCKLLLAPGAIDVRGNKCDDCGERSPSFALAGNTAPRWCARARAGGRFQATGPDAFLGGALYGGLCMYTAGVSSTRPRANPAAVGRCAACAKSHRGAVNKKGGKCEDCRQRTCNYGLPGQLPKRRWCGKGRAAILPRPGSAFYRESI